MNLKLNDIQAQVLEQILETVQQIYYTLGHDEWSVHGEDSVTQDEAGDAVEAMLVQLQCGGTTPATDDQKKLAKAEFDKVLVRGHWAYNADELTDEQHKGLVGLAEANGFDHYIDFGESDNGDPMSMLIITDPEAEVD